MNDMNIVTYSCDKTFLLYESNFLKNYDEWSYDYIINDIIPYWNVNQLWKDYPFQLVYKYDTIKNLHPGADIVGGVGATYENNELHIKRIFTVTKYRGLGIATKILSLVWRKAFISGCRYIRMWCDKDAIPFYEKLGFKMIAYNDQGYGLVFAPIFTKCMHKTLNILKDYNPEVLLDDSVWQSKKKFEGV